MTDNLPPAHLKDLTDLHREYDTYARNRPGGHLTFQAWLREEAARREAEVSPYDDYSGGAADGVP